MPASSHTNPATADRHGGVEESPLETKTALANRILDAIVHLRLR